MIDKLTTWMSAARPHTMGLSIAVILAGSAQVGYALLRWDILCLALLSAAGFQLVSNFANDYGDFKKGTDSHRPESYRALSAGNLSEQQVKSAIIILSLISMIAVIALVWRSPVSTLGKWVMFALGVASVLAALAYTLGKRPYGYYALGDVMVFMFFGLVGVVGSYYLQGGDLATIHVWTIALVFGALSTSVLNINNMRDSDKDKANHKITVANQLGDLAIHYQAILFIIVLAGLIIYAFVVPMGVVVLLAAFYGLRLLWQRVNQAITHHDYNHCLALTVKTTLLLSIPAVIAGLLS